MSISNFSFSIGISSRTLDADSICHLIARTASRISPANDRRDDNRIFWDFDSEEGEQFEIGMARVTTWLISIDKVISQIHDAEITLWCMVHKCDDYAGIAIDADQMSLLGTRKVNLLISVYDEVAEHADQHPAS